MPKNSRRKISEPERRRLWVLAGGRCHYCNCYLLEDERSARPLELAELAHNVGQSPSVGSPRGEDVLPVAERDKADNLLLLCRRDHKMIDSGRYRGEFSVEELTRIKRRHEDRIRELTALTDDQDTVVIRLVGEVRGRAVELSRESVRRAVFEHAERFPRFTLAASGSDVEIDLRGIPGEGTASYWQSARRQIDEALDHRVRYAVREGAIRHISLFALARIPLLVYLGYALDDKVPLDIYQRHRAGVEGWEWDEAAPAVSFEWVAVQQGSDPKAVALTMSLSGSINRAELPGEVDVSYSIYDLRPVASSRGRDVLASPRSLESFAASYHGFLAALEQSHPDCRELSLFPALPVSAAIALGRGLMREAQPALAIYDRAGDGYELAFEVNR